MYVTLFVRNFLAYKVDLQSVGEELSAGDIVGYVWRQMTCGGRGVAYRERGSGLQKENYNLPLTSVWPYLLLTSPLYILCINSSLFHNFNSQFNTYWCTLEIVR
jgi:hypothetical protein